MIQLISSFIIGVLATELLYFKVMRKRIVKNTSLRGINYTFRDFLIEKGFSGLIGLGIAMLFYDFLKHYREVTQFVLTNLPRFIMPGLILMFLTFMILLNWFFHLRLEKNEKK